MEDLEWKEGQTHLDFIRQLSPERPLWLATLSVDANFISAFLKLAPEHAQEVATALELASVSYMDLKGAPTIARRTATRRFDALCVMLGSIKAVESLYVNPDNDILSTELVNIIYSMHQVKKMHIACGETNQQAMQTLAQTLARQNHLEELVLCIPFTFYPLVLPAVYGIKSLIKLDLEKIIGLPSEIIPQVAHATAGLLRSRRTNPQLRLKCSRWDFLTLESSNTFCQALADSSIRGIDLECCSFESPTTLACALTKSKMRVIKFSQLSFTEGSVAEFLTRLTQDISIMGQLDKLECGWFDHGDEFRSNDEAVVQLTHAVARCHRLRSLKLNFHKYPQHMDAALAECFKPEANCQLVKLEVCCSSLDSETALRITESPLLLEALKDNYTVQHIRLHSVAAFGRLGEEEIDPWDPSLKKHIEMFATLNSAGRSYMTRDSMDKMIGSRFLGAISKDLDCLFYHLSRENPLLCGGRNGTTAPGSRKRRRASG